MCVYIYIYIYLFISDMSLVLLPLVALAEGLHARLVNTA